MCVDPRPSIDINVQQVPGRHGKFVQIHDGRPRGAILDARVVRAPLPLGVRTIAGVMLQIDKSLEECAQMCGASWGFRVRTVTIPLLVPGLVAAWLLLFIASVRELGASILLMGPHSKVITPSIVESWFGTSSELTAALALIQTLVVAVAMIVLVAVTRRVGAHPVD